MFKMLQAPAALLAGAVLVAGCAENSTMFDGSGLTTSSVTAPEPAKADPVCTTLATQIDSLKKEGIADKVAQASIKKYKMTTADLAKADQLNRTNTEFQTKCSTVKPAQTAAAAAAPAQPIAPAVAKADKPQ